MIWELSGLSARFRWVWIRILIAKPLIQRAHESIVPFRFDPEKSNQSQVKTAQLRAECERAWLFREDQ